MINPAGNSLLAAQLYGSAPQQGAARPDIAGRRTSFDDAAREAQAATKTEEARRSFPVDEVSARVEVQAREDVRADEGVREDADARSFAREAPGTAPDRPLPPGSQLDIRV